MLFDKETAFWQNEYEEGNISEDCGMIACILDGTAEREFFSGFRFFMWSLIPTFTMGILGYIQNHYPPTYAKVQATFKSWGLCLGVNIDPTLALLLEMIGLIVLYNIIRAIRRRYRKGKEEMV